MAPNTTWRTAAACAIISSLGTFNVVQAAPRPLTASCDSFGNGDPGKPQYPNGQQCPPITTSKTIQSTNSIQTKTTTLPYGATGYTSLLVNSMGTQVVIGLPGHRTTVSRFAHGRSSASLYTSDGTVYDDIPLQDQTVYTTIPVGNTPYTVGTSKGQNPSDLWVITIATPSHAATTITRSLSPSATSYASTSTGASVDTIYYGSPGTYATSTTYLHSGQPGKHVFQYQPISLRMVL